MKIHSASGYLLPRNKQHIIPPHLGLEDAAAKLHRMEELQNARQEMNRTKDEAV